VSDNYYDDMLEKYCERSKSHNQNNYHFGITENLRDVQWSKTSEYFKSHKGIPIICSHAREYYHFLEYDEGRDVFEDWQTRNFILFSLPDDSTYSFKRFYPFRFGEISENETIETYRTYYTPEIFDLDLVNKYPKIKQNGYGSYLYNIHRFDSAEFMSDNGFEYAKKFVEEIWNVKIPNSGKILHKIWYDKVISQIY